LGTKVKKFLMEIIELLKDLNKLDTKINDLDLNATYFI
jgi:hypothetical protein